MKWYYSPSTKGFYNDASHPTMPEDVLPITDDERANLLHQQSTTGASIEPGPDGRPVARDRSDEIRTKTIEALESEALRGIARQAIDHLIDTIPALKAKKSAVVARANALRGNTEDPKVGWPE